MTGQGSTNFTSNTSAPDYIKEPLFLEVTRLTVEVSIAVLGVLGNVLVCHTVTSSKKLHSVANFHIRNLAIADLGVLLINFPLAVIKEQDPTNWPLGEFFCRYIYPIGDVFHGVSVWSITAIAIDRYRAIVGGIRRDRKRALKTARATVILIWLVSFLIVSLPLFFVIDFKDLRPLYEVVDCTPSWPDRLDKNIFHQTYMIGIAVFWYILPLSVIISTYIKIGQRLKESSQFHKAIRRSFSAKKRRRREQINAKAKKLLTPVVVTFAVTMFPLNALRLAITYWEELHWDRFIWVYYNITVICVIANSSVNCLIYALVSAEFRREFKKKFYGWHSPKQHFESVKSTSLLQSATTLQKNDLRAVKDRETAL
ncbi:neuropeptide Y receptor type 2-like [Actinia tenebrosa]|uniref:Neuropeptide Y receptor type 2-like n=1 Tax=Actinia tenebrosa TaxID=6105 RepID=A0A6P8IEP9_ACTTE|nr:neuropeptide Y receptor type 2-like [Actinia tenebrosa]